MHYWFNRILLVLLEFHPRVECIEFKYFLYTHIFIDFRIGCKYEAIPHFLYTVIVSIVASAHSQLPFPHDVKKETKQMRAYAIINIILLNEIGAEEIFFAIFRRPNINTYIYVYRKYIRGSDHHKYYLRNLALHISIRRNQRAPNNLMMEWALCHCAVQYMRQHLSPIRKIIIFSISIMRMEYLKIAF